MYDTLTHWTALVEATIAATRPNKVRELLEKMEQARPALSDVSERLAFDIEVHRLEMHLASVEAAGKRDIALPLRAVLDALR